MMTAENWPWVAILLLGAWHGVNPGMGWLFATALGMQEGRSGAVVRALVPLAVGHALAIAAAAIIALAVGVAVPLRLLEWVVAALLIGLGATRLVTHRHPRYGGMRVNTLQLTVWSLLMASAHGAGLMVLPFVLRADAAGAHGSRGGHAEHAAALLSRVPAGATEALAATAVHTLGYLAVTAAIALVVYRRLGLRLLRRLWVNLDLVWGAALILTGVGTLLL